MPCSDGRDGRERIVYIENLEKVDELTRMLCSLCRAVDEYNKHPHTDRVPVTMPNNIGDWWKRHKKIDDRVQETNRIAAEKLKKKKKLRRSGLSKLTDEERTALGHEKRR